MLDQLGPSEDFLITVRPAEARKVVDQRVGQVAHVAVRHHRRGAVALAEPRAIDAEDERDVCERRHRVAERPVEQDLLRRVGQVVLAADDVRDPHVGVVDDGAEIVRRRAVGAHDDEVVEFAVLEDDVAFDEVGHHGLAVERGLEAHDERPTRRGVGAVAAGPIVHRLAPGLHRRAAFRSRALPACSSSGRPCRPAGGARSARRTTHCAGSGRTGPRPTRGQPRHGIENGVRSTARSSVRGRCPRSAG